MVRQEQEQITDLTPVQAESMMTAYPAFVALKSMPSALGYAAHERLEEVFSTPIASDDSRPEGADAQAGQRTGFALGDRVGREREFTRNLPTITANVAQAAEERGVPENQVWDEIHNVLVGSGIGQPMHRTLHEPLEGSFGMLDYLKKHGSEGITIIVRGAIANWQARRHQTTTNLLGSMPSSVLPNVRHIIYAGGGRVYSGDELWRPAFQPYIIEPTEEGKPRTSTLTEASAADTFYVPQARMLLGRLGLTETLVHSVGVDDPAVKGDAVMQAVAAEHGDSIKNGLIIEVGNAPAGYIQLAGGLVLARELGITADQFVAVSDAVDIVQRSHFNVLSPEERSKVQNAATGLNSINGWLKAIVRVNQQALEQNNG